MRQRSSARVARCGRKSESSIQHWPCLFNTRGLAITFAVGLMKASLSPLVIDSGRDWPCHFCNPGLGSNRSIWLGPPSMNSRMTFFALPGKWGCFGAIGSVRAPSSAVRPSEAISSARANVPRPPAHSRKKLRRVCILRNCVRSIVLFPRHEFVQVEDCARQSGPGGGFGAPHTIQLVRHRRFSRLWIALEDLPLFLKVSGQAVLLARCRRPCQRDLESVIDSIGHAALLLLYDACRQSL